MQQRQGIPAALPNEPVDRQINRAKSLGLPNLQQRAQQGPLPFAMGVAMDQLMQDAKAVDNQRDISTRINENNIMGQMQNKLLQDIYLPNVMGKVAQVKGAMDTKSKRKKKNLDLLAARGLPAVRKPNRMAQGGILGYFAGSTVDPTEYEPSAEEIEAFLASEEGKKIFPGAEKDKRKEFARDRLIAKNQKNYQEKIKTIPVSEEEREKYKLDNNIGVPGGRFPNITDETLDRKIQEGKTRTFLGVEEDKPEEDKPKISEEEKLLAAIGAGEDIEEGGDLEKIEEVLKENAEIRKLEDIAKEQAEQAGIIVSPPPIVPPTDDPVDPVDPVDPAPKMPSIEQEISDLRGQTFDAAPDRFSQAMPASLKSGIQQLTESDPNKAKIEEAKRLKKEYDLQGTKQAGLGELASRERVYDRYTDPKLREQMMKNAQLAYAGRGGLGGIFRGMRSGAMRAKQAEFATDLARDKELTELAQAGRQEQRDIISNIETQSETLSERLAKDRREGLTLGLNTAIANTEAQDRKNKQDFERSSSQIQLRIDQFKAETAAELNNLIRKADDVNELVAFYGQLEKSTTAIRESIAADPAFFSLGQAKRREAEGTATAADDALIKEYESKLKTAFKEAGIIRLNRLIQEREAELRGTPLPTSPPAGGNTLKFDAQGNPI
jgi:hypothetical protein